MRGKLRLLDFASETRRSSNAGRGMFASRRVRPPKKKSRVPYPPSRARRFARRGGAGPSPPRPGTRAAEFSQPRPARLDSKRPRWPGNVPDSAAFTTLYVPLVGGSSQTSSPSAVRQGTTSSTRAGAREIAPRRSASAPGSVPPGGDLVRAGGKVLGDDHAFVVHHAVVGLVGVHTRVTISDATRDARGNGADRGAADRLGVRAWAAHRGNDTRGGVRG